MPEVKNTTEARQGERGKRVLVIGIISTAAAVVLAILAYAILFSADNEDVAEPIPETNELSQ